MTVLNQLYPRGLRERDPFEIVFSFLFAFSGLLQLVQGPRPGVIDELLPGWFRVAWLSIMIAGSVAILVGVFRRCPVSGLFIESWGLFAVAVSLAIYGAGIVTVSIDSGTSGGIFAGPMTLVLAFAFYWKHRQINQLTKRLPRS